MIGAVFAFVLLIGSLLGAPSAIGEQMGGLGVFFGFGSMILFPIFYALLGAVGGLIMAGLYNLVARLTGGIEVEIG
jgi:hypothetical protein